MRGNGFESDTPDHPDNDHNIDKQHRGRDIFTGIQRLAEQEVKCRKPAPMPKAIINFFTLMRSTNNSSNSGKK